MPNKLLLLFNSLIDIGFDSGENEYISVNSYGVRWVKDSKSNATCLNKQQIKDAVAQGISNRQKKLFFFFLTEFWSIIHVLI